jgi:CelD/BcsL family acetyltransferase involved in cellulose biosynthesis
MKTLMAAELKASLPLPNNAAVLELHEGGNALLRTDFGAPGSRPGNVLRSPGILETAERYAQTRESISITACIRYPDGRRTVWPLRITRHLGLKIATDLTDPITPYSDVAGAPLSGEALALLCDSLRADHGIDALLARRVRADSGLHPAFTERYAGNRIETAAAPYIDLSAYADFDAYCSRFGKHTRRNRQQRRRRMEEECGELTFEVAGGHESGKEIDTALGWKRDWLAAYDLRSSVFDGGVNERLLRDVCADRSIRVSTLRSGGRPVAVEIGGVCGDYYAAYIGAFDPRWARFSTGQEQMLRTIGWCITQGFKRYDLLADADSYKLRWTDASVAVNDFCVALSPMGNAYSLIRRLAQSPARRRLNELPPSVRRTARRYGPMTAGLSAAGAAFSLLAD